MSTEPTLIAAMDCRELERSVDAFLDDLRFAATAARDLGLRVDLTLGSGWPYGGPQVDISRAAGKLRIDDAGEGRSPCRRNGNYKRLPVIINFIIRFTSEVKNDADLQGLFMPGHPYLLQAFPAHFK